MADNISTLGIEVKTSGVAQAASDLQKLSNAATSAEKSTGNITSGIDRVNAQLAAMGEKAKNAGNSAQSAWRHIETGIKPVEQAVQKVSRSFEKAEKSAEGFAASTKSIAAGGVLAAAVVKSWDLIASSIGKAIEAADEYTRIESRLRGVTGGAAAAAEVQKDLFKVAQDSRQGFIELANTYSQVARATKDLGISQGELLDVTKTVSQAVALSGSSSQAAQAAMIQFSQAMASGVLRGEELNSIMEQTPRLAQAIAQGMGIGIGELRKLGQEGELTAQKVLGAIAKSAGDIDREFKSMTPTVADGFTKLGNSAKNFIDVLNDATGASKLLYRVLNSLSGAMDFTSKGLSSSISGAQNKVLEARVASLQNKINSLGAGDFRKGGLQAQLDQAQSELFKAQGKSLAGGAEMPVLPNKATGPSSAYLSLTQKMSGVSADFYKNLRILNDEYGRTGNLKQYQAEVKKLIETETEIGKDSVRRPRGSGGGRGSSVSEEAKAYQDSLKQLAGIQREAEKSTLDLTAAEEALYDLQKSPVWANMPQQWRDTAMAQMESAKAAEEQAKFLKMVEAQEQSNVKSRQSMIQQIQDAEKATEMYGLTAAQVSVVEQARIADAIAILEQDRALKVAQGASEAELTTIQQRIDFLREEMALRGQLSDVLSNKEGKQYEQQDAENAIKGTKDNIDILDEYAKSAVKNIQSSFADFLFDPFEKGTKSMAKNFADAIKRMAAEAVSAQSMKSLFGGMGQKNSSGGGGDWGLIGSAASWMAKAFGFHEGGIVGAGGASFTRSVHPMVFANAERFHSGGFPGLKSDEVPAILQRGEQVLTKEQQRARAPQSQNIRIVNAFDTSVIANYLGSSEGEKVIINAVNRNASAFKQAMS